MPHIEESTPSAARHDTGRVLRVSCAPWAGLIIPAMFVLFMAIPGPASAADPPGAGQKEAPGGPESVLLQADVDFDRAVAEKGVDGWVSFFAPDGIMFRSGEVVQGHAAIMGLMAPAFDTEGFTLRWKPVHADIAASGDLGYTYGTYESKSPGQDGGTITRGGMYVTIWKRQADGSWKVAVDLGSSSPPPPPKPAK